MKTKKTILNFITEVVPILIIMFIGLYKSKLLIINIKEETVGLYQLFSQLLGYVTIFEFGMTGALLYRFFEPVSKKDQNRINILFSTGQKVFKIVALVMFVMSIGFSLVIPFLIKDNPFSLGYIMLTFTMYVSTNIIYYLIVSYKLLLETEQKKHITNLIVQSFEILKTILEVVAIVVFKSLIVILSVGILTSILSSICIVILCKKNNPELKDTKEKDYSLLKDVKALFVHKIAYLVNNNIDLIIVTKYIGLGSVVIYSTYNFIINSLKKITSRIYTATVPALGNLLVEDKEKAKNILFEMNDFMYFIAILLFCSLVSVINPFINIWYEGKINVSFMYAIGFSLVLFVSITIQPLLAFTDAGGFFKETKKCALLEAIINLALSVILLKPLGVFGILLATFIGYMVSDNIIRAKIICNKALNTDFKKYFKDMIIFYLITGIISIIEITLLKNIVFTGIFSWLLISCLIFIFNIILLVIIFKVLNKLTFVNRVLKLVKIRK